MLRGVRSVVTFGQHNCGVGYRSENSKGIDVARDKSIEQLTHLKGKFFDRDFVRHEIQDHEKAIAAFKREADKGANPQIKSYAQQTLPTLEKHLHQAGSLAKPPKQGCCALATRAPLAAASAFDEAGRS